MYFQKYRFIYFGLLLNFRFCNFNSVFVKKVVFTSTSSIIHNLITMLTILQIAYRLTVRNWQMTLFIFIINLVFAVIIAQPFYATLSQQAANSMEMNKIVEDFDFMVFSDFLRVSGKKLTYLFPLILILGIIYFLLNLFFAGGIIDKYANPNESFSVSRFMNASKRYFFRFLGIFLLQILLSIVALAIVGIFFVLAGNMAEGGSERTYFYAFLIPFSIFVILFSIVWQISDYAKVMTYKENCSIWKAYTSAIKYVFQNPKTIGLYWILIGIFLILSLIYLFIDVKIGMTSALTIGVMFVLQQVYIFLRIFLRNWQVGVASEFYSLKPIPNLRRVETSHIQELETIDTERLNIQEDRPEV